MNTKFRKLLSVMLSMFVFVGVITTPVLATEAEPVDETITEETEVVAEEEVQEEVTEPTEEIATTEEEAFEEVPAEDIAVTVEEEPAIKKASKEELEVFDEEATEIDLTDLSDYGDEEVYHIMAEGDPTINAGKTVTDGDGDGIYELALSINATSQQSSSTDVTKSNVVMVIDVSGSMNYSTFETYTYSADTYDSNNTYYSSTSVNNQGVANGYRVVYDTNQNRWEYQNGNAYTGTVYRAESRLAATKRAACAVVDALLAYNNNSDGITDIFEISVVKFAERTAHDGYNGTEEIVAHSNNATTIKDAINNLSAGGGTHWRAALERALTSANWYKNNQPATEKTSVIFLTDGFPTERGTGNDGGSESNENVSRGYLDARAPARNIVQAGYTLYGIFAFGSDTTTHGMTYGQYNTGSHTGFQFLRGLTNYAYGTGTTNNYNATTITDTYDFNAKSTSDLVDAFKTIINHITNSVGYAGVNLSDGVSLGATSTSVAVNGTAKTETMRYTVKDASDRLSYTVKFDSSGKATFTIYNADGTTTTLTDNEAETVTTTINGTTITSQVYSVTVGSGDDAKTYKMSPATINASNGMVKWDLAGLGILENGYTYTVAFDVWPNQLAYDIAADLNNGIYASVDAALDDYDVTDATERQHIKDAIVHNADGSYSLYTNYEQAIEYYPATSHTDDEGNVTWEYGGKQTQELPHPDPIPLKGSLLPMGKIWESDLAQSELNELLWVDGIVGGTSKEYQITLHVWKAENEADVLAKANAPVSETNQPYITEVLGWDATTNSYIWNKDAAVAPGVMVNLDEAEELGFDITETSNIRTFTNEEGVDIDYYVIEPGHYYFVTEEGSDLHFEFTTPIYHPMIVDGTLYNVAFGEGQTVEKMDPMYAVEATNTLKGGLNIHKIVSTTMVTVEDGELVGVTEPVDEDGIETVADEFTFEIKIWKEDEEGTKTAVYTYDDLINTDANPIATKSGSLGYRIFSEPTAIDAETGEITYGKQVRGAILTEDSPYAELAGDNFATIEDGVTTITLTMPANGEIRLVNAPAGTKYEVKEIVDESGVYNYGATVSSALPEDSADPVIKTTNTVNGTISGNKANVETYYNWTDSYFYVYHSSDNTIEKIGFTDTRVKGTFDKENSEYDYSFNIAEETKKNYLYGGYFKAYAGAGMTDDQIVQADNYAVKDGVTELEYVAEGHKGGEWISDTGESKTPSPYTGQLANQWTWDEYTESGLAMSVEADKVYYLKEVPDTRYLQPYTHFTYYKTAPYNIGTLWMISDLDDVNYSETGFIITKNDVATVCKTLTVKTTVGGNSVKLTPQKVFSSKGVKSFNLLTYCEETSLKQGSADITMYWITKDNVFVTSAVKRNLTGNGTKNGLASTDTVIPSTIKDNGN